MAPVRSTMLEFIDSVRTGLKEVPEPMLVNLWRTNLWHVLIGTDRDPSTGLYEHGAGTYTVSGVPATQSHTERTRNAAGWTLAVAYSVTGVSSDERVYLTSSPFTASM